MLFDLKNLGATYPWMINMMFKKKSEYGSLRVCYTSQK